MSDLTYSGTSGWSGTDTSRERAEAQDADGRTGQLQRLVLTEVARTMQRGVTVAELRSTFPGRHHGSLSSALTNLHRAGRIARLSDQRGRCKVYVHPMFVGERETEQPKGREPKVPGRPTACVYRSSDGQRWVVHVDTTQETGHVTVYINDGDAVFDQDPEHQPDDEPERPTACEDCGMSYDACTNRILRRGKPACCGGCASRVTHNQNEWESWSKRRRNATQD